MESSIAVLGRGEFEAASAANSLFIASTCPSRALTRDSIVETCADLALRAASMEANDASDVTLDRTSSLAQSNSTLKVDDSASAASSLV